MNINTGQTYIYHIFDDILNKRVIIPEYQREYCWDETKINIFIDSVIRNIPIGVLQFRILSRNSYEVIDGLHRIRTILNILLGKGIYFNFETKTFTQDKNDYDYSGQVFKKGYLSSMVTIGDRKNAFDFEKTLVFQQEYEKVYRTQILKFEFEGADEEIRIAFDRINQKGVAFTPVFKKVESSKIFSIY